MGNILQSSKLDFSNKQLTEFPLEILEYKNLRKLNLSNNRLTTIPAEIESLRHLKVLDLSHNSIMALGAKFFNLVDLEVLIINSNKIKTIPKQIEKLTNLKKLSCSGNRIENLPQEIEMLKKLRFLNISNNPMVNFPNYILELDKLETLSINKNKFTSIPKQKVLHCFPCLKRFYCFNPSIEEFSTDSGLKILQREKGNSLKMLKLMASNEDVEPKSSETMKNSKPKHIFISYSHRDKKYKDEIVTSLKAINYAGFTFSFWVDDQLESGVEYENEIGDAIKKSDIVIFIVSMDFMSSTFIQETELPTFLEKAKAEGTRFLIVVARKCPLKYTPLGKYQTVNTPDTPLNGLSEHLQDAVYNKLVEDVIKNI